MKRALGALLIVLLHAGCNTPVPIEVDPQLMASIPPELARERLAQVLGQATTGNTHPRLEQVQAGPEGFSFVWTGAWSSKHTSRYTYAQLDPHAYTAPVGGKFIVRLTGPLSWECSAGAQNDCVWLVEREQVQALLEALASLQAAARSH